MLKPKYVSQSVYCAQHFQCVGSKIDEYLSLSCKTKNRAHICYSLVHVKDPTVVGREETFSDKNVQKFNQI